MKNSLSLTFPYYNSPMMLEYQIKEWWGYEPLYERGKFEIILIDDCSLISALDVLQSSPLGIPPYLSVYRVLKDIPWNQHGCRNLGAKKADNTWLFLTDIDHTVPFVTLEAIMENKNLLVDSYYTFNRMSVASLDKYGNPVLEIMLDKDGLPKPHPNTFLLTKDVYWKAGGYDEDYCGTYGGDGPFKRAVASLASHKHLSYLDIIRWPRSVISDASQPEAFRQAYKLEYRKKFDKKGGGKAPRAENPVRFPWEKVL